MFGGSHNSQLQLGLATSLDALTGLYFGLILRYTMFVRGLIAHILTEIIANRQY